MNSTNNKGDIGSPYRSPLEDLKYPSILPLSNKDNMTVVTHVMTNLTNCAGIPS